MSKGDDLKKIISNWERQGTLKQKEPALNRIPNECVKCNNNGFNFWGETDEELVFRCKKCGRYYSIPFKQDTIRFYFSY